MFGKELRKLRKEATLLLRELSEPAGLSIVHLSDIERGKRPAPRDELIQVFCNTLEPHLGRYPDELLLYAAIDRGYAQIKMSSRSIESQQRMFRIIEAVNALPDDQLMRLEESLKSRLKRESP